MIDTFLILNRKWFTNESTIGELSLNDESQCFTLEDTVRRYGDKVYGQTAIPAGKYEIAITFSSRFQRPLPLLLNVPDFQGIRIHCGNQSKDTEGCILVGKTYNPSTPNLILDSRTAFNLLYPKIEDILKHGKLFITINGGGIS